MSVLEQKRTTSKVEFINTAYQIYVETLNFFNPPFRPVFPADCGAYRKAGR